MNTTSTQWILMAAADAVALITIAVWLPPSSLSLTVRYHDVTFRVSESCSGYRKTDTGHGRGRSRSATPGPRSERLTDRFGEGHPALRGQNPSIGLLNWSPHTRHPNITP